MDIRTMQYFLTIAREGSFTKAAEILHMTQPPLSRQMKDLETELGVTLFDRSGKRISLTEEGTLFRERAQEVVDLMRQIRSDMNAEGNTILGEVRIACGETDAVTLLSKAAKRLRDAQPGITYRLFSGDKDFVVDKLEHNAADIGLLVTSTIDTGKYDFLKIPTRDTWGVLMAEDSDLARKEDVEAADIVDKPLMLPYRAAMGSDLMAWFGEKRNDLNIVATYDLAYNVSRFAKCGFGYAVTLDGIVDASEGSGLAFRPLRPPLMADLYFVWRKDRRLSRATEALLDAIRVEAEVGEACTGV